MMFKIKCAPHIKWHQYKFNPTIMSDPPNAKFVLNYSYMCEIKAGVKQFNRDVKTIIITQ